MKLRAWWTSYPRTFDIVEVKDTVLPYLKQVVYWHPDFQKEMSIVSRTGNIID